MKLPFYILVPAFTLLASGIPAAEQRITEADYARINAALVDNYVLPRYARLTSTTAALAEAARKFCNGGPEADPTPLRQSFDAAMGAWMEIQHLRFGPVTYFNRSQRFHFWPQARGKVTRSLNRALKFEDAALEPDRIARTSAAIQGFPAAERLIFDDRYLGNRDGCRLLRAITANLQRMASGTEAGWTEGNPAFADIVKKPGPNNSHFLDHQEATLALFRSLHDGLQFNVDVRLRPVLGGGPKTARPHLAESRASERSARNVADSLMSLGAFYHHKHGDGFGSLTAAADPKLDRLMRKAFRLTLKTASSITAPLEQAATDPLLRPGASKLLLQSRALTQIVRTRLAKALGVAVGFNSLDGD